MLKNISCFVNDGKEDGRGGLFFKVALDFTDRESRVIPVFVDSAHIKDGTKDGLLIAKMVIETINKLIKNG